MSSGGCCIVLFALLGVPIILSSTPLLCMGNYALAGIVAVALVVVFIASFSSNHGTFVGDEPIKRMMGWMFLVVAALCFLFFRAN